MGGVFEESGWGRFLQMGHPPPALEWLGSPNGREEGRRREELQRKREGLGHSTAFSEPGESLGPLGCGSCHLGWGRSPGSRGLVFIVRVQA